MDSLEDFWIDTDMRDAVLKDMLYAVANLRGMDKKSSRVVNTFGFIKLEKERKKYPKLMNKILDAVLEEHKMDDKHFKQTFTELDKQYDNLRKDWMEWEKKIDNYLKRA